MYNAWSFAMCSGTESSQCQHHIWRLFFAAQTSLSFITFFLEYGTVSYWISFHFLHSNLPQQTSHRYIHYRNQWQQIFKPIFLTRFRTGAWSHASFHYAQAGLPWKIQVNPNFAFPLVTSEAILTLWLILICRGLPPQHYILIWSKRVPTQTHCLTWIQHCPQNPHCTSPCLCV